MHLKPIVVQDMDKDQVVSGWTMFDVLDLKQELKSVAITDGGCTIVAIPKIYQLNAYRQLVRKFYLQDLSQSNYTFSHTL